MQLTLDHRAELHILISNRGLRGLLIIPSPYSLAIPNSSPKVPGGQPHAEFRIQLREQRVHRHTEEARILVVSSWLTNIPQRPGTAEEESPRTTGLLRRAPS